MMESGSEVLEVRGVPPEVPDELLVLYFENRRRSGGGPVRSCRRRGGGARLTFERPEDVQGVLSRTDHVLQEARLEVRPAAPQDYRKGVLQGLRPQTPRDLLELYVERMLDCERGDYALYLSPAGDQALVQLPQPLSSAEFLALAERVRNKGLEGSSLTLDGVEQTDSLLVRSACGAQLKQDLLELYFESRRSAGGALQAVRLIRGGSLAVVSFQDPAVAERVLQRPHQLSGVSLDVSPHYDFLEPPEEEEEEEEEAQRLLPAEEEECIPLACLPLPEATVLQLLWSDRVLQDLVAPAPACSLRLEGSRLCVVGGDPACRRQLRGQVQAALAGAVQELLPFSAWVLGFLQREDVQERLVELLAERGVGACYVPGPEGAVGVVALTAPSTRLATSLLASSLCHLALPLSEGHQQALASPCWAQVEAGLRCCQTRLAQDGGQLEVLTMASLEQENRLRLEAFLQDGAPDEVLVAAEPGPLRYLQLYRLDLLASLSDYITLLPLEGPKLTGLQLSGAARACREAAEFLHSLLGALRTHTVTLRLPGLQRFLLEEPGRGVVRELERRFHCAIGLEQLHWHPPEAQHHLERSREPLLLACQRDLLQGPEDAGHPGGAAERGSGANLDEVKGLLAALQPPKAAIPVADGSQSPVAIRFTEEEEDLYTDREQAEAGAVPQEEEEEEEGSPVLRAAEEEDHPRTGSLWVPEATEEDAQLLLAIQASMDSARREEEELRQAMEMSLRSWELEQHPPSPDPDLALQSALSESLEGAEGAQLTLCLEGEGAGLAQELEAALQAWLREERVDHVALHSLPAPCLDYLAYLERKHAVRILLEDTVATVRGFADYPVAATRDLALLLSRLLRAEAPEVSRDARWVRWEPSGQGSPTPYSAEASALLEQAWRQGHKRVDAFFGRHPFVIDLEHMEEHDLGSGQTLPVARNETPPAIALLDPAARLSLAEGQAQLVPLDEGSEEFQATVRHFYDTLDDLHNKIRLVKASLDSARREEEDLRQAMEMSLRSWELEQRPPSPDPALVEKLLHPLLYQQYQLKKAAMEKACGHQQVERLLYHGTTEESSREICQHGFNRSFCGKNATCYGHGVYFAAKAFLSAHNQYSPRSSPGGNKYIFVARTLVGDYVAGDQSMRAPPQREGDTAPRRYDSTVDNPLNPSIFVIFNDTQAYPQFLITCQWSKPR